MAEITVRDEGGRPVFVVKYIDHSGPRPTDYRSELAQLKLAFAHTPGAARGESRHVAGHYFGDPDGGWDDYECPVEPSPANVVALEATGFAWDGGAAALAARHPADPALVARIGAAMDQAHRDAVAALQRLLERLRAGEQSAELIRALGEVSRHLA
jgi:hypothetical protein